MAEGGTPLTQEALDRQRPCHAYCPYCQLLQRAQSVVSLIAAQCDHIEYRHPRKYASDREVETVIFYD